MATKKPVVQIVLEKYYYEKLKIIATSESRSLSNQGARIVEKFINDYEKIMET